MKPCFCSDLWRIATSRLRLQKMIAFLKSAAPRIKRRKVSRLAGPLAEATKPCAMVIAVEAARATSMRTGLCKKASVSLVISGGMVAEKNKVCRVKGTSLQMRSISGMNPMSSIRSASSMTRISIAGQKQLAAFGKIQKAARRRDQDIGAPHDLGFLIAEGNAANQQRDIELMIDPVAGETFLDLRGKLAGRLQDQGARHPCPGAAFFQPRQHRKRESRGLAGAGLGNPEHVASGENMRDRFGLNGGRREVARGLDGLENLLAEAKFAKCHSVPKKGLLSNRPRREPALSGPPGFEGRVFALQLENPRNPELPRERNQRHEV